MTDNVNVKDLITLQDFCETCEIDFKRARRLARKGQFEGALKVFGKWAINASAEVPVLPEAGTRVGGSKRADGRRMFKVYLTEDEAAALSTDGYELRDMREARKTRKAEREAAAIAALETAEDILGRIGDDEDGDDEEDNDGD